VLAALAGLAVICTAVAFLGFFALIAEAGPARASVITYVNPAVAVALGVGILGEHLTAAMAIAFVLILGGSVLATRTSRPSQPDAQVAAGPAEAPSSGTAATARLDSRG
jgi:drug/metabolite transporter (DMT)-like permease